MARLICLLCCFNFAVPSIRLAFGDKLVFGLTDIRSPVSATAGAVPTSFTIELTGLVRISAVGAGVLSLVSAATVG